MPDHLKHKPTKAEQHAIIKAARGMFRSTDGKRVDWAAVKEEDCRLEKRRDDLLTSMGKGKPLRTDLAALVTARWKKS